ncbi:tRNA (adenine(22)-N(1))-methyltransferase [Clostridium intestinale]|uniref:SAM-dependent methyltransferase n=1 Tax=Clostridium intestinale TaxID=36845 RepID=A0A7D6VN62_9CLOT|nr:class I SAM-dependent methyltransferase [Clostridium intestinale]QLY78647.1 SAM-dependent methyltransferase [Clostridium intestinale]
MELSKRLMCIVNNMDNCESMIDVGTDHGYIPIYAVKNKICTRAIASDINRGPKEKAESNVRFEGISDKIQCRLGAGLSTVKLGEVEAAIIAGMGGNLIRDIIVQDIKKVQKFEYMILQPAQNAEILREFLYKGPFDILKEDLVIDENIFYEVFKVKYNKNKIDEVKVKEDSFYYELSTRLIEDKHPLIKDFIQNKLDRYKAILSFIKEDTESAVRRKEEITNKINRLKELII